jgi:hypothetical protein
MPIIAARGFEPLPGEQPHRHDEVPAQDRLGERADRSCAGEGRQLLR